MRAALVFALVLLLAGCGFQLRYAVGFRVHDGKGHDFVVQNVILLTRDVTFNDAEILSKEAEEQFLYRNMQADMAQLIMRRIAASQK